MSSATRPTKPAAIHSMVSMKRSIDARFMLRVLSPRKVAVTCFTSPRLRGEAGLRSNPGEGDLPHTPLVETLPHPGPLPARGEREKRLLRQRLVLRKRGFELRHRGVRIDAGLLHI